MNSFNLQKTNTVNDPELHRMEQIAILGITKAKDLAKMFMLFAQGKLISKKLLQSFEKPQIFGTPDKVVWLPLAIGHGFSYEKHPYEKVEFIVALKQQRYFKLGFISFKYVKI